jgi:pimeloyl-ACP methyl ester carboxylesterase
MVLLVGLACVIAALTIALQASAPQPPGPFYKAPSPLPPGPPGTIIRKELIKGFYRGTRTYRVLYKSTGFDGRPTAVSGVIVVPEGPPPKRGRRVIAFTHGTVGVASNCAPSLQKGKASRLIEGLGEFVAAGYVVAATDYQGLGTPGPSPYLVGRVEAMNALDSVRAAHSLRQAHAGVDFASWGHSQGGQASLFTGQLAPGYAPELHLVGVAAGAPVPNLKEVFEANINSAVGRILIAMALSSWARLYPGASLDQIVAPLARDAVRRIASVCLYGNQILGALPSALGLGLRFITSPPWSTEPWRNILAENDPGATPIAVPVLVTQGGADKIVPARATEKLVGAMCAKGEKVELRLFPSVEHLEAGIIAAPDVAAWIADRFAGRPPPSTCPVG